MERPDLNKELDSQTFLQFLLFEGRINGILQGKWSAQFRAGS